MKLGCSCINDFHMESSLPSPEVLATALPPYHRFIIKASQDFRTLLFSGNLKLPEAKRHGTGHS